MKFLCMVFLDEQNMKAMSEAERHELDRRSQAYDRELKAQGHFIAAEALQSTSTAASIRFTDGSPSVTDGPFIETNEYICGFILIEAQSRDEAIEIAKKIPVARFGGVEVRPVLSFS
ncbi:MAG: YciI family protein [Terracidiphilus sp.]